MVLLFDESGRRVNGVLSGTSGFYRVFVPAPGRYRLRVERIGYADTEVPPFDVAAGEVVQQRVTTAVQPVELGQLDVAAASRCQVRPEGVATATVWDEARKALEAATWTAERGLYRFAWMTFERWLDADGRRVLREERRAQASFAASPFTAIDPAQLADEGFIRELPGATAQYFAPDANVLLSDPFLDTHCFRLERPASDTLELVGLGFEPIAGRARPDIVGVLWLERESARLRSLEYRYVNHPMRLPETDAGGEVTFAELPNGTWIVKEWRIRMPEIVEERDRQQRFRRYLVRGYRHTGGIVQRATTASGAVVIDDMQSGITGVVVDSAGGIAQGTRVWVEGTAVEDTTDTDGRFSLPGLGAGTWLVRSTAWPAEAFGYVAGLEVTLGATGMESVRLTMPSVRELALAKCAATPTPSGQATLLGRVVDADGNVVPGAAVEITWTSGVTLRGGPREDREGVAIFADERGAFVHCGVPATSAEVRATSGDLRSPVRSVPIPLGASVVTTTAVLPRAP
jgi:hypothetical protein